MSNAAVEIRCATRQDLPAIERITAEVFQPVALESRVEQVLGRSDGVGWLALKMAVTATEIDKLPDGCFVAVEAGEVIGFVTNVIFLMARRGYISSLAVRAGCQGRGVGRALVSRSLDYFRGSGLKQAKIDTLVTNQVGQHLYPAMGFQEATRAIHYVMPL
jgi:ribosomal protein S18 acetylase RimI-like enzyme